MKRIHTQKKSARRGGIKSIIRSGNFVWKSKFVMPIKGILNPNYKAPIGAQSNGTYVRPKKKHPVSFTQSLRNQRGYDNHLNKRYAH